MTKRWSILFVGSLGTLSCGGLIAPDDGARAHEDAPPLPSTEAPAMAAPPQVAAPGPTPGDRPVDKTLAAPRAVAPLSTATSTSQRPILRWILGDGEDGADVEMFGDRACTIPVTTFHAQGTSGAPEVALGRGGGGSPGNSGVCPSQCRSTLRGCDGRGRVGVHQHRPTCRGDEGQRGPLRRGRRAPLDVTGVGTVLKPDGRRSEQASDRAQDVHACPHDE